MPFTPCHAAAVLPFLRTPLPASALVIGSTAPDLPYFVPVPLDLQTHSVVAIGTTDLAVGALAWLLWHGLLAAPALAVAPRGLRARLVGMPLGLRTRLRDVRSVLLAVAALALGAATHVLWDEFTHERSWGPAHLPALTAAWGPLPGWAWLQYGSSVVGAAVLLCWVALWVRRTPAAPVPLRPAPWWPWALVAVAGAATGGAVVLLTWPDMGMAGSDGTAWGGGAALAVATLLAGAWRRGQVG